MTRIAELSAVFTPSLHGYMLLQKSFEYADETYLIIHAEHLWCLMFSMEKIHLLSIIWWIESSKEQHLYKIGIFCNIMTFSYCQFDHHWCIIILFIISILIIFLFLILLSPEIILFSILWWIERSKEQHLFETWIFRNINVSNV